MNTILSKRLDTRTLLGATLAALAPGLALGGPQGEAVVAGQATVGRPDALTTLVQQTSASAVLNWSSFNVGADEFVVFNQPSSSAVVLNRVIGNDASQIFGSISANGRVFLSNQNGVLFAPGARLDVNGLVATTFNISDDDFMAGRYAFVRGDGAPDAGVVNQGAVQTGAGGFVVLAGDFVRNDGVIASPAGRVVLASGARTTLNLDGMGLVDFAVDEATLSAAAGVANAGQILAEGGMVVMTARVANQLVGTAVNNSGLVRASRIADQGGELWLAAEGGDIVNSGVLDASGVDGAGGRVVVVTDRDATLAAGGALVVDGGVGGAGGEVRAVAGGALDFQDGAAISARGGDGTQAAGGFVEVSGHGALTLAGQIDLGSGGSLLIDPSVVMLTAGTGAPASGAIPVSFISAQLDAGNDVKILASNAILESAAGLVINATNPAGDLFLEIGTAAPPCANPAPGACIGPPGGPTFGAYTPAPGGNIQLTGTTIVVGGVFHAEALNGLIGLGNVTAGHIELNANPANAVHAAGLEATVNSVFVLANNEVLVGGGATAAVDVDLRAIGNQGGRVVVNGGVTAGNNVHLEGRGSGSGGISGVGLVQVDGAIDAGGDVDLLAQDHGSGASGGRVTVGGGIAAHGVDIGAYGDINVPGGGVVLIGAGSGGAINTATIDASGSVNIEAVGGSYGGIVVTGAITTDDAVRIQVLGGDSGGGSIIVAGHIASSGTISSHAPITAGDLILLDVSSVASRIETGDLSGSSVRVEAGRGSSGSVAIRVGDVTAFGSSEGGGSITLTGTGSYGSVTVQAGVLDALRDVEVVAAVAGGGRADIQTGNIVAGGDVLVDNDPWGAHSGSIAVGDVDADRVDLRSRTDITAGDLVSTTDVYLLTNTGDITVGDLSAVNLGAPVAIRIETLGSASNVITVGAITATGQRAASGSNDMGVHVDIATGYYGGTIIITGPIVATGIGRAFSYTYGGGSSIAVPKAGGLAVGGGGGHGAFSSSVSGNGSGQVTGFAGGASVHLRTGSGGTITVSDAGGITISGVGFTMLDMYAGTIDVAGPIALTTTPGDRTETGRLGSYDCFTTCDVDFTETLTNYGEAELYINTGGTAGLVQLGAVTVTGPLAEIDIKAARIETGALIATGGNLHYQRSSSGTLGGAAQAFADDFLGGAAEIRLDTGGATSGSISVAGDITVNAPGHAEVSLLAATVAVDGDVAATVTGGVFIRDGEPAASYLGHEGPFGQEVGDELPTLDQGTYTGGFAIIGIGGMFGSYSCSSSCGVSPANQVTINGGLSAQGPGVAVIELSAFQADISGGITAIGGPGSRVGTAAGTDFDPGLGLSFDYFETIDFNGGVAQVHVQGDGELNVGGPILVQGAFANVDLGMSSGALGDITLQIAGGVAHFNGSYDASGTINDYTESFHGPGLLQGIIVGPDSGGGGSITVGDIALDAVGFGAVIIRAGTVTVGAIDVDVASANYVLFDSRVDSVPNNWVLGDAFIAVHDHGAPGAFGRATVDGPVTVDAAGAIVLRSQLDVAADPTRLAAVGEITEVIPDALLRINEIACDDGTCSFGSYAPVDLAMHQGELVAGQGIELPTAVLEFGSGAAATGGDPLVVATHGLASANPNGIIKSPGAVHVGEVILTGDYLLIGVGQADGVGIGLATVAPGAVVQFTTPGPALTLEQTATGANVINVADQVDAFLGQGAELVFGHSVTGGQLMVAGVGPVGLAGESVTLIGNAGISGTGVLAAAALTTASGTAVTSLVTDVADLELLSAASSFLDNSAFTGTMTLTLPASAGSIDLMTGGALDVVGAFAGTGFVVAAGGDVTLNDPVTASGTLGILTGGQLNASGALAAGTLELVGTPGVSDFVVTTNAAAISVEGADSAVIDNSARTGATTVTLVGTSPDALDVVSGGALTLAGGFDGTTLTLDATSLALGASAHTATGTMTLVTDGALSGTGLLTTTALVIDAVAASALTLTTDTQSISIDQAGSLTLNNAAETGGVSMALPTGLASAALQFGGSATLSGAFNGTSFSANAAGDLDLTLSGFAASGAVTLVTGGFFSTTATLAAGSLVLDGVAGTTDFAVTTQSGAITVAGADAAIIDNSGHTGATTLTLSGGSPTVLDVLSGGALTLVGGFNGSTLNLEAASLNLGTSAHTASGVMSLTTGGAFTGTGTLAASFLALDGTASTTFAITTTTSDLFVAGAGSLTVDCTPVGGLLSVDIGSAPFTAVNVDVAGDLLLQSGVTAGLFAATATGDIIDASFAPLQPKEGDGLVGMAPAANPPGTFDVGTLFLEAGGDLLFGGATFILGTGDDVTGVSDLPLLRALAGAGIGPADQMVSNGAFLAGGTLELGAVTSAGSYLVLQGDQLVLTGPITGPSDLLVQVAPATPGNTFSVESSSPGSAATNYTFSSQLGQITARTLVIGSSTMSGAATVGGNGAFDVTPLNLIIATGGAVTDIGNVTSTGIVDTLAGLLGETDEVPVPIVDEIDPGVADPAPPVDTGAGVPDPEDDEDEDDEGEDAGATGTEEGGDDAALVTQQTMPAGICGK